MDNVPLLNSQFHSVGLPLDWSLKVTERGAQPDCVLEEKLATGPCPKAKGIPEIANMKTTSVFLRVL